MIEDNNNWDTEQNRSLSSYVHADHAKKRGGPREKFPFRKVPLLPLTKKRVIFYTATLDALGAPLRCLGEADASPISQMAFKSQTAPFFRS